MSLFRLHSIHLPPDVPEHAPDYVITSDSDGKIVVTCNRPMAPARAVELAKMLLKVAGVEGELLPMGAIR